MSVIFQANYPMEKKVEKIFFNRILINMINKLHKKGSSLVEINR
jgi:hypothetical protein